MFRRALLLWLCFLVLAFVNGAFRELVLIPRLGLLAHVANQLSCVTGVVLWTLMCAIFWRRLAVKKLNEAVSIGLGWFFATMLFETFVINHKLSWRQILHTYDVSAGEYWGFVLLWIGLMPIVAYLFVGGKKWSEHHP
jgi:hypothetical protein